MQIPTNQNRDLAAESLASCYLLLLSIAAERKKHLNKTQLNCGQSSTMAESKQGESSE